MSQRDVLHISIFTALSPVALALLAANVTAARLRALSARTAALRRRHASPRETTALRNYCECTGDAADLAHRAGAELVHFESPLHLFHCPRPRPRLPRKRSLDDASPRRPKGEVDVATVVVLVVSGANAGELDSVHPCELWCGLGTLGHREPYRATAPRRERHRRPPPCPLRTRRRPPPPLRLSMGGRGAARLVRVRRRSLRRSQRGGDVGDLRGGGEFRERSLRRSWRSQKRSQRSLLHGKRI